MNIEDNIRIGIAGIPHTGKEQLNKAATITYPEITKKVLAGNFWVPEEIISREEVKNKELFDLYSADPEKFAFRYQVECLANRLRCQQKVGRDSGIVLQIEPLEVEKATYGEANKEFMGDSFSTYCNMAEAIISTTKPVHLMVYLQIKEENLPIILGRIEQSGREGEKKFLQDPSYLRKHIKLHEEYMKRCGIPVITVDATHPAFGKQDQDSGQHLKTVLEHIVQQVQKYKTPPRLELWQWETADYNRAQEAARNGRRQLRKLMQEKQVIISVAGVVASGKSGLSDTISDALDILISKELSGKRNSEIIDPLLFDYLQARTDYRLGKADFNRVRETCYALQIGLIEARPRRREEMYVAGKSFIEDRSIEEDPEIFWRLFLKEGILTQEQFDDLKEKAKERYSCIPKSNLIIMTDRSAMECKKLSSKRGRSEEEEAWSLKDMEIMRELYDSAGNLGDFYDRIKEYNTYEGPRFRVDMNKFDSDSDIHKGWLWQEIMFALVNRQDDQPLKEVV